MPIKNLNNKGIAVVPLAITLVVFAVAGYFAYQKYTVPDNQTAMKEDTSLAANNEEADVLQATTEEQKVLQEVMELAPKGTLTTPKNSIEYVFLPDGNSKYNGRIQVRLKTWNTKMIGLAARLNIDGMLASDYCNTSIGQRCPINTVQVPEKGRVTKLPGVYASYEIKVWSWTKAVQVCQNIKAPQCKNLSMSDVIVPVGWKPSPDGLSIVRVEVEPGFSFKSIRNNPNSVTYNFSITGIGENANILARSMLVNGVKIIRGESFAKSTTQTVYPDINIRGDGVYSFSMEIPNDTLSFYFINKNLINFNNVKSTLASGWKINAKGDGFDKVIVEREKPAASLISISPNAWKFPSYDQEVLVRIEGANKSFIDDFNKNGMLIVNNDGSTKKVNLKMNSNGTLSSYITLNLVKTQKLVFVNLIPQVAEYRYGQSDNKGNYWELLPLAEGGGIKRGSRKE